MAQSTAPRSSGPNTSTGPGNPGPDVAEGTPTTGDRGATATRTGEDGSAPAPVRSVTVAVVLLGAMAGIQGAGPTIASTALAEASSALGMTGGLQALAASISTFVLAGTVVSTGILADRLGRRRVLAAALLCSMLGDLVVAVSPGPATYLVGRALAGVGLGAVFAASFAYLRSVVPRSQLAKANGLFAAVSSAALIALSFLGGTLATGSWRLAFLVVPVASLVCLFATFAVLPALPPVGSGSAQVVGQVLLGAGVISLLYGVSQAGGGLTQPTAWAPIVGGVALLVAWYVDQDRSATPFFPTDLLRNPLFVAAIAVGFVYNFAQAVVVLQTANLWQYLDSFSTVEVSAGQWPFLLAVVLSAFLAGRWINGSMSHRTATLLGGLGVAAGFVWIGLAQFDSAYAVFVPGLVLVGLGIGLVQVVFGTLILKLAPADHLGPVTSAKTTIGQIAYSIGLSVSVILMNSMTDGGVVRRLTDAGASPTSVGEGLDAIRVYTTVHTEPSSSIGRQALGDATTSYSNSFTIMMLVFAGLLVLMTIGAVALLRSEDRDGDIPEHVPAHATRAGQHGS